MKTHPSKNILVISTGFLIIYLIIKQEWPLYVSLTISLAGIGSSYLSKKIDTVWMQLSKLLGAIFPKIILTIFFYGILTPIAWLSRIFGAKDPLKLKNTHHSYFKDTNKQFDKHSFEKIW